MKQLKLSLLILLFVELLIAQSPTQTIRGIVLNANTYRPLEGAVISLLDLDENIISDADGSFRLVEIPIGRQQLQVSYLGFKVTTIPILVESGKEVILEIPLAASASGLDTIVIKAPRIEEIAPLSTHTFTIEETLRLPSTYYDPARMMATYAGVINVHDGTNNITVRGHSPNHLSWRLEGVEIVNPNHTSNAGTLTDLPTLNGGGVNMLSAQMLSDSRFYKGNFPTQHSNVVGGLLDMRLRKGNNERHEFIGQIGIIGIDVAAEGPIHKSSKASYLANYRYSTLGLLGQVGVDLGDEAISYQDAALNLSLPTKNAGDFKLFGVWGKSANLFTRKADASLQEEQKDLFDIDFLSDAFVLGTSHQIPLGKSAVWKTSAVYSASQSSRLAVDSLNFGANNELDQSKLGIQSQFSTQLNAENGLDIGIQFTQHNTEYRWSYTDLNQLDTYTYRPTLVGVYANWSSRWGTKLKSNIGLHLLSANPASAASTKAGISVQPRFSLDYQLNASQSIHLGYGLHSQNLPYGTVQVHQLGLNYHKTLTTKTTLDIELYWHELFDLPTADALGYALNIFDVASLESISITANKARNYGLEVSLQRYITDDFYFIANATLFDAIFEDENGEWRDSRWNNQYAFNLTGGKEWTKQKKKARRIFGLNARVAYGGGLRSNPIDINTSNAIFTNFTDPNDFSTQYPDFYRVDIRLYWKRNKSKHNSMLSLDINNVTNAKNVAFEYYDALQREVITKYQLGLIPILSWRIEL